MASKFRKLSAALGQPLRSAELSDENYDPSLSHDNALKSSKSPLITGENGTADQPIQTGRRPLLSSVLLEPSQETPRLARNTTSTTSSSLDVPTSPPAAASQSHSSSTSNRMQSSRRRKPLLSLINSENGPQASNSPTITSPQAAKAHMSSVHPHVSPQVIPETTTPLPRSAKHQSANCQPSSQPDKDKVEHFEKPDACSEQAPKTERPNKSERKPKSSPTILSIRGKRYFVLNTMGRGGSGRVFRALCEADNELYAVKEIVLNGPLNDLRHIESEINLLQIMSAEQHAIRLIDYEHLDQQKLFYIVLELGSKDLEHILRSALTSVRPQNSQPQSTMPIDIKSPDQAGSGLTLGQVRYYWEELLKCVEVCHRNSIIHSDLKPANFVSVATRLKIIDFGIAKAKQHDHTSVLSQDRLGTVSYMSPEHLANESPVLRPSTDVWALGCILFQMIWGYTPYQYIPDQLKRALAVMNSPVFFPAFPRSITNGDPIVEQMLLDVLGSCLNKSEKHRLTVYELLEHPFVTGDMSHWVAKATASTAQDVISASTSTIMSTLKDIIHEQRDLYRHLQSLQQSHNQWDRTITSTCLPPDLCSALCDQQTLQQFAAVLSQKLANAHSSSMGDETHPS